MVSRPFAPVRTTRSRVIQPCLFDAFSSSKKASTPPVLPAIVSCCRSYDKGRTICNGKVIQLNVYYMRLRSPQHESYVYYMNLRRHTSANCVAFFHLENLVNVISVCLPHCLCVTLANTGLELWTGRFSYPAFTVEFHSKDLVLGMFHYLIARFHY